MAPGNCRDMERGSQAGTRQRAGGSGRDKTGQGGSGGDRAGAGRGRAGTGGERVGTEREASKNQASRWELGNDRTITDERRIQIGRGPI